jgi:plastocyanin
MMKNYVRRFCGVRYATRAVLCLALFLVACGDQPAATSTPVAGSGPVGGPTTITIDATGFKFVPAEVTIPAGSTVIWTNKDSAKHSVTADNGAFDSGTMEQGATFSRKFDTPGTIGYFCKFHGSAGQGMIGKITVVAAAAGAGGAAATPPAASSFPTPAPPASSFPTPAATLPPAASGFPTPAATNPPAASSFPTPAGAERVGSVNFRDDKQLTDQVVVTINAAPAKPAGKALYAWLLASGTNTQANLGRVEADTGGPVTLRYSDPQNTNLIATYDRFEITTEALEGVPSAPSTDIVLSGQLPPQALVHIRHLLVSFPDTPNKVGLEVGLRGQMEVLLQHAQFMRDAQAAGKLAEVKLHAEHLVNLIEGSQGAHYGDLNKDGQITNPGDGFGLLPNGSHLGYLQGSKDHAELASVAPDATADIKLHAGHVAITVDNVTGWVTPIRDHALAIIGAPDLNTTAPLARDILTLAQQSFNGVDLQGDGQILPIPGSGGALTSYQHAQLMAAIPLQAGNVSVPAGPAPAAPTATTQAQAPAGAAAANAVQIPIHNFLFGTGPLTVKVGTTVTWINEDSAAHTATADNKLWDSGVLQKGQSFSFTFKQAGQFPYYCTLHGGPGGQGMASSLTVEP